MARKQTRKRKDVRGGALGDFAEQVGTLLGQAEARWRTWQGPETREAIVETVQDVRDRASALLKDMGAALPFGATSAAGKGAGRKRRKAAKPAGSARQGAARPSAPRKSARTSKAAGASRTGARARR